MDFGRPLETQASIASQSQIRLLEPVTSATAVGNTVEERTHNVQLDNEVVQAANETAAAVFLGSSTGAASVTSSGSAEDNSDASWLLDASHYTDRVTPTHPTIQAGDLVVIQESFDRLDFVYCQPGAIYNNRNGAFHHRDFLGQPFGSKLRSRDWRGYGFIYLLKPTPELWTRSLNHRTQVVHELDQSQIVFQLHLQPNCVVVESGTGSGALSHALLRTVAPAGHLHTYEFSAHRVGAARREFAAARTRAPGDGAPPGCVWQQQCVVEEENEKDKESKQHSNRIQREEIEWNRPNQHPAAAGGFDLPPASVDAVVLDLPEPWVAVPHAAAVLRSNARIATYSPCVEQTQRTCEALELNGFHSVQTFEYRLKEYYVDAQVEWEAPPAARRPRHAAHNVLNYTAAATTTAAATGEGGKEEEKESGGDDTGVDQKEDCGGGDDEPIADDPTETTFTTTPATPAAARRKQKAEAPPGGPTLCPDARPHGLSDLCHQESHGHWHYYCFRRIDYDQYKYDFIIDQQRAHIGFNYFFEVVANTGELFNDNKCDGNNTPNSNNDVNRSAFNEDQEEDENVIASRAGSHLASLEGILAQVEGPSNIWDDERDMVLWEQSSLDELLGDVLMATICSLHTTTARSLLTLFTLSFENFSKEQSRAGMIVE